MLLPIVLKSWLQRATFGSILIALISIATPASSQNTNIDPDHQKAATPIKHVIVLIGESPGWNFSKAPQFQAVPAY
jgi:hypothetical protein